MPLTRVEFKKQNRGQHGKRAVKEKSGNKPYESLNDRAKTEGCWKGSGQGDGLKCWWVWGAWVAQSVKRPTSAQVMISWSVSSSPASGSVLTAQSLEPVSDSVSPSL